MRWAMLTVLLIPGLVFGDDPLPNADLNPDPAPVSFAVAKGVEGTGKRTTPFIFDAKTRCVLMLPEGVVEAKWDVSDGPTDLLVLAGKTAAVFSLENSGEFLVTARWKDGEAKSWFVIHAGPAPPPTPATASQRVTKALIGGETDRDAKILIAASEQILVDLPKLNNGKVLLETWFRYLAAAKWVKGSRPEIAAMIGAEIKGGVEVVPFTAEDKTRIEALFTAILEGSKGAVK